MLHVRDAHATSDSQRGCVCAHAIVDAGIYKYILLSFSATGKYKKVVRKQYNTEQFHPSKTDIHTRIENCCVLFFVISGGCYSRLKIYDAGRNQWEIYQISAGLLCSLKGIQQKSQSYPPDKVRVSHATFCGKHSAQQMDPKLFDTCCLHSEGSSLELIMETHPGTLHPTVFVLGHCWLTMTWTSWGNLTGRGQLKPFYKWSCNFYYLMVGCSKTNGWYSIRQLLQMRRTSHLRWLWRQYDAFLPKKIKEQPVFQVLCIFGSNSATYISVLEQWIFGTDWKCWNFNWSV